MTTKTFEIRDRGTFVPMLAIRLDPVDERDRWLLARADYGREPESQRRYVILLNLVDKGRGTYDPYGWESGARTFPFAHQYIIDNFDALPNGSVVCVEHILGERAEPKKSEQSEAEWRQSFDHVPHVFRPNESGLCLDCGSSYHGVSDV